MLKLAFGCLVCGCLMLLGIFFDKKPFKPCLYVATQALNIRESPNIDANIYGKLHRNDVICEYFSIKNDFLETKLGWVSLRYLRLNPVTDNKGLIQEESKMAFKTETKKPKKFYFSSIQKPTMLYEAQESLANADYKRAKSLALQINQANPKNIKSWEIFIKSMYLEGNKKEAISILEQFLAHSYDESLTRLLEKMRRGNKI
ncbi:MAG: SH3 domain-containing protein [Helicobacter sp.]|nr:SH3 domain-containing protein [Helicobacter sp.]